MRYLASLSVLAFLPGILVAQQKAKVGVQPIQEVKLDRKEPVLYDKDVEPILIHKCQFCHSGSVKEGKLDMGTYDALIKGGKRGQPIIPGKAVDSLLIKLAGRMQKLLMPP